MPSSIYIIDSLAWDGASPYASTDGNGVWRYAPEKGVWTDTGGDIGDYAVCSLAWDGSGLYAGTIMPDIHGQLIGKGVWRYNPGTGTWTNTGGVISDYGIYSLAWDGSKLYAGTLGQGVWLCEPPAPPALSVTSVSPNQGTQLNFFLDISVAGTGLQPGAALKLKKGDIIIDAFNENVASDTQITGTVGLFGVEPGDYDVVVVNPGNQEAKLAGEFKILNAFGQGAGASLVAFGIMMGLLSLAGSGIAGRRLGKRKTS